MKPSSSSRHALFAVIAPALAIVFGACGGGTSASTSAPADGGGPSGEGGSGDGSGSSSGGGDGGGSGSGGHDASQGGEGGSGGDASMGCGTCPAGSTCGSANGIPVCRTASGIPRFTNVYVVVMENTSLSTLAPALANGTAPHMATMAAEYATGSDYHGVAHPSLPNYIAMTSGGTQGISCDCKAQSGQGTCNIGNCSLIAGSCTCTTSAMNLGDQLDAAKKSWMDFGEDMGAACNVVDSGNYAVRHNPFLYYDDVQGTAARCNAHVVDFKQFNASSPAVFNFIAPNLVDDMHNPDPPDSTNIPDGDAWLGPHVDAITGSAAFKAGGLLVVVWDEDDGSGGITGTDDPIPIFVLSPFAKHGGYVSSTKADHYALLATIEDGLGLPRLGMASGATPLADYFPAK